MQRGGRGKIVSITILRASDMNDERFRPTAFWAWEVDDYERV